MNSVTNLNLHDGGVKLCVIGLSIITIILSYISTDSREKKQKKVNPWATCNYDDR